MLSRCRPLAISHSSSPIAEIAAVVTSTGVQSLHYGHTLRCLEMLIDGLAFDEWISSKVRLHASLPLAQFLRVITSYDKRGA